MGPTYSSPCVKHFYTISTNLVFRKTPSLYRDGTETTSEKISTPLRRSIFLNIPTISVGNINNGSQTGRRLPPSLFSTCTGVLALNILVQAAMFLKAYDDHKSNSISNPRPHTHKQDWNEPVYTSQYTLRLLPHVPNCATRVAVHDEAGDQRRI